MNRAVNPGECPTVRFCVAKYRKSQVLFLSLQASHFSKMVASTAMTSKLLGSPLVPFACIAARCPTAKLATRLMGEICKQDVDSEGNTIICMLQRLPNKEPRNSTLAEGKMFYRLPSAGSKLVEFGTLSPWLCDIVLPRFTRPFAYVENQWACFFASAPDWTEVCQRVLQSDAVSSDKLTPDEGQFLRQLTSDMANPAEAHQACSLVRITPAVRQLPDYSGLNSLQPIVDVSRVIYATVPAPRSLAPLVLRKPAEILFPSFPLLAEIDAFVSRELVKLAGSLLEWPPAEASANPAAPTDPSRQDANADLIQEKQNAGKEVSTIVSAAPIASPAIAPVIQGAMHVRDALSSLKHITECSRRLLDARTCRCGPFYIHGKA